ncbi:MAG: Asp23/Gls24 family envelope stress response protein [Anaerolineales bacterium]|nr:Asp23/Gls24 family envelope stress response protein [Anaerolineales bacterium]
MSKEETTLGSIHVSPNAVATIAYHATLSSYGVVGLAPKNLAAGLAQTITREPSRGVSVHYDGDKLDIDIFIIVQHGTRIASVATSVANTVRFNVEKALGVHVDSIDVHVAGLRISDDD